MKDDFLYIFVHVPKTAGSTFGDTIRKNFKREEVFEAGHRELGLKSNEKDYKIILTAFEKKLSSLTTRQKVKIKIIQSHIAPYGVHSFFNKECRYVTFLRDPFGRVISIYNYLATIYEKEKPWKKSMKLYGRHLLIDGKTPSFENWYKHKFNKTDWATINLSIKEYFQALGFLPNGRVTKKGIEEMLAKFYFVGFTENFEEDSLFLYYLLGINKFVVRKNVSKKFFQPTGKVHLRGLVKNNLRDAEAIIKAAKLKNKNFKKREVGFSRKVNKTRIKKTILLPITQMLFDFKYVLGRISSVFRKVVPYYAITYDKIKRRFNLD